VAPPPEAAVIESLGWKGGCPDPSLSAEELGLAGSDGLQCAGPLTLRFIAQALLAAPRGVREQVGRLLLEGDEHSLLLLDHPDLDRELRGVVRFSPEASLRGILENVEKIAKAQKEHLRLPKTRRRNDVLDGYLDVWDRREGWAGGGYDPRREKRLRDIALKTREKPSTVQDRYESAFKLVVGVDYDPDLWAALFGPMKIPASKLAGWRKKKGVRHQGRVKVVTETTLLGQASGDVASLDSLRGGTASADDSHAYADLIMDLRELVAKGRTDDQIAVELELPAEVIRSFREHMLGGL
jgi:hypothetical protein